MMDFVLAGWRRWCEIKADDAARRETAVRKFDANCLCQAEASLKAIWGPSFERNRQTVLRFLEESAPHLRDRLLNARLGDGVPLGSDAQTILWLFGLAQR